MVMPISIPPAGTAVRASSGPAANREHPMCHRLALAECRSCCPQAIRRGVDASRLKLTRTRRVLPYGKYGMNPIRSHSPQVATGRATHAGSIRSHGRCRARAATPRRRDPSLQAAACTGPCMHGHGHEHPLTHYTSHSVSCPCPRPPPPTCAVSVASHLPRSRTPCHSVVSTLLTQRRCLDK